MVPEAWLSPKQVAGRLGVHPGTIRKWISMGKLPAHQPSGKFGNLRVLWDDYMELADRRAGDE